MERDCHAPSPMEDALCDHASKHMNNEWCMQHSGLGSRHKVVAVRGKSNALTEFATADPLGEEIRRHVGVVDFPDRDELVVHALH